ncbi:MAG: prepilin-type N-terminal cleavage/methylation domain-containing protein [Bdellovibrio sp.]|nr:prepilin-type N-terminal cleavage/methylation domain-containing protein [Bdellovibrio sp.]
MFSSRNSQRGFSLVELMVVVAIIGILATIAIPSVGKYMAKARQSEAKTMLSSLYTSEKAFFAEYNAYHSKFQAIGYSPEGQLRYNVGFGGTVTDAGAGNGYNTTLPTVNMTTKTYCGAAGTMVNGCTILVGSDGAAPDDLATGDLSQTLFTAYAIARIRGTTSDTWTMTQDKVLSNPVNGIQ